MGKIVENYNRSGGGGVGAEKDIRQRKNTVVKAGEMVKAVNIQICAGQRLSMPR